MRLGVIFPTKEIVPVEAQIERFRDLEARGFASGWLPQSTGFDALTVLALAGAAVPRIELGTAVVPTFPRHPIVLAAQALTTSAATGGRLALGLGLSHRTRIEGSYGLSYDRPTHRMREYLAALLPLMRTGSVDVSGDSVSAHIELSTPGAPSPPVLLAALQPRMLGLAGSVADGTITWCTGPITLNEQIVPLIGEAARAAGRQAPRVCAALPAIVTDDDDYGRRMGDIQLEGYRSLPVYRAVLDRERVDRPGDLTLAGNEAAVTAQLRRLEDIGVTDFIAVLCGTVHDRARTLDHLATLD